MEVRSIWDLRARQQAAELAFEGQPIAVYNRTVCALIGRGESLNFFNEVVRIKGEARQSRPLAFFYRSDETARMVDPDQIPSRLHPIFLDPYELEQRFGGLCFFRLPIRTEVAEEIPDWLLSRNGENVPIMMVNDPKGQVGLDLLLKEMHRVGVRHMSGTSMNRSGTREIVDQSAGIEFARAAGIPLFLTDSMGSERVLGSPTIFNVNRSGVHLVRDSFVPWQAFEPLFGMEIDTADTRPANWPQLQPHIATRSPYAYRRALLKFVARQSNSSYASYLLDGARVSASSLTEMLLGWTTRRHASEVSMPAPIASTGISAPGELSRAA